MESTTEIPPVSNQAGQPMQPPKKSKVRLVITILVVGFIGAIALTIAVVFFATRGAVDAATVFIDDLRAGNCSAIYDEQVTERFQSFGAEEDWAAECERVSSILTGEVSQGGVSVHGESGKAATSTVEYAIVGNDDTTYDVTLELEKVEGEWKVDAFNSEGRR